MAQGAGFQPSDIDAEMSQESVNSDLGQARPPSTRVEQEMADEQREREYAAQQQYEAERAAWYEKQTEQARRQETNVPYVPGGAQHGAWGPG